MYAQKYKIGTNAEKQKSTSYVQTQIYTNTYKIGTNTQKRKYLQDHTERIVMYLRTTTICIQI